MPTNLPRFATVLAIPVLAALLLAAPAAGKQTGSKYDKNADFSKYKTFRWVDNPKARGPRVQPGADLDVLIRGLVTEHLRSKGLEEKKEGDADLTVTYDAVAVPVTNMESLRHEITPGVAWVMDGTVTSYLEGNLVLTISDAGSGKPVWSAWTTEKIKEPDSPNKEAVQIDKQVRRVVKKLMSRYPPK